jgi:hypothetical protein
MTLEQAPTSGQRQRLIALLRQTYRTNWSDLLKDFDPAPGWRIGTNSIDTACYFCAQAATAFG